MQNGVAMAAARTQRTLQPAGLAPTTMTTTTTTTTTTNNDEGDDSRNPCPLIHQPRHQEALT